MLRLYFTGDTDGLRDGIIALSDEYGYAPVFEHDTDVLQVEVTHKDGSGIIAERRGSRACITFDKRIHFFRALGLMLEKLSENDEDFAVEETAYFTMNGPMYDVSQGNAVINLKTVKYILRRMAIMGLNMLMLYCEDSYDVPSQPYFGYMRARYSEADLRTLDDYADMFGIEMIPCIQTLAHLVDVLKWDVYRDIREDDDCLLVGSDKTYAFIRDLISFATRPFRSKRIHIGMDEAWYLGRGTYQDLHGVVPKSEIMRIHLQKVMKIVREMGLTPMMWSDMFFRSANPDGSYYNVDTVLTPDVIASCPKDVQLVYWDYYHNDSEDFYLKFIDRHREFGEPIFAGGIWTWMGFAANYTKTFRTMQPALMACKRKGVKEVFATIWGDRGTECSILSTLLGLSFFAEHGYNFEISEAKLRKRFEFCCKASFDDFMALRYLDETPGIDKDNLHEKCPSKFLMWQDILGGLFDKNIEGLLLDSHYEQLAACFKSAFLRGGELRELFEYNYHVANVLAVKSEIGLKLAHAYISNDRSELTYLGNEVLPDMLKRVHDLHAVHRRHWFNTYKAFGWDIMDMRYGTLLTRIDSAITLIDMYLKNELDSIEELEETRLDYNGKHEIPKDTILYHRIVSASRIAAN